MVFPFCKFPVTPKKRTFTKGQGCHCPRAENGDSPFSLIQDPLYCDRLYAAFFFLLR